jgi:hypothetical protein
VRRDLGTRFLTLTALWACSTHHPPVVPVAPRDWAAHPAIAEVDAASIVYGLSDVHGGLDRMVSLLHGAGLTDGRDWIGGSAVLVVAGDLIDKGPQSLEVIDALMMLQAQAEAQGGRVVVTLGNHEAEFLADPSNSKANGSDGIDVELTNDGIDRLAMAEGRDPRGAWLRDLPFAAHVGEWFFAHAGNTAGRTIPELEAVLRAAVDQRGFGADEIIGTDSILEARSWWTSASVSPAAYAQAVSSRHIVMGHDPHALGAKGDIAESPSAAIYRIDCGMSPDVNYSDGRLLRIRGSAVDEVDPTGASHPIAP